ncbi:MAG: glycosyltransferase, partial [Microgenomates group bacterium]
PENKVKVIYPCLPKSFSNPLSVISNEARNLAKRSLGSPQSLDSSSELDFKSRFLQDNIEKNFCLYVGDATWNKNLVNLAKAIKIANVTCIFAGRVFENFKTAKNFFTDINIDHPWNKELKEFLKEIEGDQRFIFAGFVDDQTLINLYKQARCNLLISRDEGFGFSFLEAASQGCPSILSKTPVFQEIAQNNALFVDPNNPNDIADKIIEIYFDKKYRDDLGQKAKNHSQNFSPEVFKRNFKEII